MALGKAPPAWPGGVRPVGVGGVPGVFGAGVASPGGIELRDVPGVPGAGMTELAGVPGAGMCRDARTQWRRGVCGITGPAGPDSVVCLGRRCGMRIHPGRRLRCCEHCWRKGCVRGRGGWHAAAGSYGTHANMITRTRHGVAAASPRCFRIRDFATRCHGGRYRWGAVPVIAKLDSRLSEGKCSHRRLGRQLLPTAQVESSQVGRFQSRVPH